MPLNLHRDDAGATVQVVLGSGSRVNLSATAASTAATALPAGSSKLVIVRAMDWCYINFGTGAVVAATNATSILLAPGEGVYGIPSTATHFALIRIGAADVQCQVESVR